MMEMSESMVERVAKALALGGQDWLLYVPRARAAIGAMREPTEAMLANTVDKNATMRVLEFTSPDERSKPFLVMRYSWRAMIDAALSPSNQTETMEGKEL
jgi:hypothetical protein